MSKSPAFFLSKIQIPFLLALLPIGLVSCKSRDFNKGSLKQVEGETVPAVYQNTAPLTMKIRASFSQMIQRKSEKDEKGKPLKFPAIVTLPLIGREGMIDVKGTLEVRGRNSLGKCRFPKLRLRFEKADVVGTLFEGATDLKLGTHCDKVPTADTNVEGTRLAVSREEALLRLWRVVGGDVGLRSRIAQVRYEELEGSTLVADEPVFLTEDPGDVAKRLAGRELKKPENLSNWHFSALAFSQEWVTLNHLFQALVGNSDWGVWNSNAGNSGDIYSLYNVGAVSFPNGDQLVYPVDLDLSATVTLDPFSLYRGAQRLPGTAISGSDERKSLFFQLLLARGQARNEPSYQAAVARFVSKEKELRSILAATSLDESGRIALQQRLDIFLGLLKDETLPPLVNADSPVWETPDGKERLCTPRAATPVRILDTGIQNGRKKIRFLNETSEPPACGSPGTKFGALEGWIDSTSFSTWKGVGISGIASKPIVKLKVKSKASVSTKATFDLIQMGLTHCEAAAGTIIEVLDPYELEGKDSERNIRTFVTGRTRNLSAAIPGCDLPGYIQVLKSEVEVID